MIMRYTFFISFLFLSASITAQQKIRNKTADSEITYTMKHLVHTWSGTSKALQCMMETDASGVVKKVAGLVSVRSFDSKNSNRDSHMLEVTEALRFPNISFESVAITPLPNAQYDVEGKLSFHGVQQPIRLVMTETKRKDQRIFAGSFTLLLEDFKVYRPSFMMVKTDNEVKIDLSIVF